MVNWRYFGWMKVKGDQVGIGEELDTPSMQAICPRTFRCKLFQAREPTMQALCPSQNGPTDTRMGCRYTRWMLHLQAKYHLNHTGKDLQLPKSISFDYSSSHSATSSHQHHYVFEERHSLNWLLQDTQSILSFTSSKPATNTLKIRKPFTHLKSEQPPAVRLGHS